MKTKVRVEILCGIIMYDDVEFLKVFKFPIQEKEYKHPGNYILENKEFEAELDFQDLFKLSTFSHVEIAYDTVIIKIS